MVADASVLINAAGLGKRYVIGVNNRGRETFREMLTEVVTAPFRRRSGSQPMQDPRDYWALHDISFEIRRGEALGIIGRNGAGKSTLLKILGRIVEPTCGRAEIRGRIASLLEVGTGFHSELTGRENIFLNGAILGMRRAEIRKHFDEIVAFAGVERFLDTPVKHYSSGMYVRLAFAVAAHLSAEIMLIDEVLAVGDVEFQRKCLSKMSDVAGSGRTILFVSHDMRSVQRLCNRALLLHRGECLNIGNVEEVVGIYLSSVAVEDDMRNLWEHKRAGDFGHRVRIVNCSVENEAGAAVQAVRFGETFSIALRFRGTETVRSVEVVVGINSAMQARITTISSDAVDVLAGSEHKAHVTLRGLHLNPGRYTLTVGLRQHAVGLDHLEFVCPFVVDSIVRVDAKTRTTAIYYGDIQVPELDWSIGECEKAPSSA